MDISGPRTRRFRRAWPNPTTERAPAGSSRHCDERRPRYRAATAFGASAPEDARRPRYRQLRAVPSRTGVYAEHHLPKGGSTTLTICIGYRRCLGGGRRDVGKCLRSEEHTSELQSLMRISYAVFCLKKKKHKEIQYTTS